MEILVDTIWRCSGPSAILNNYITEPISALLPAEVRRACPSRKAKYLVRYDQRPRYFAISATPLQKLFRIDYGTNHNRFRLIERADPIVRPLLEAAEPSGEPLQMPSTHLQSN